MRFDSPTDGWRLTFQIALVIYVAVVLTTLNGTPSHLATSFDAAGRVQATMSRQQYMTFMLVFGVGVPLFVVFVTSVLCARWPQLMNIPHREHWLQPGRREFTLRIMRRFGYALALILLLFSLAIHALLLDASDTRPPRLSGPFLGMSIGGFLVMLLAWAVALTRAFRRPDT